MSNLTCSQFTAFGRNGQLVLSLNSEILLPENAPVRLTRLQLEELDYSRLYAAYSSKGRKSKVDPSVLFQVIAYAYQCGIYSSRKIEEACRYRVDFMWLLDGQEAPDHATIARFRTGRCKEALEDLFYQLVAKLENMGEVDHQTVFIDGTKIESAAGRYTFCWKKNSEKQLSKVKAQALDLGYSSLESLHSYLETEQKKLTFVHGIGHRKSPEQKHWEELNELYLKWVKYEKDLEIMGESRNSYSKTDKDATFMRMKEDHMRNGQLKPAYNLQIAVNSEYITGLGIFSNRTDFGTLVPLLQKMKKEHGCQYEEVCADAGYESLDNYLYLEENGQMSFIKPSNYEQKKTKKFKNQIGKVENMQYDPEEDCFTCAAGRKLPLRKESSEWKGSQIVTTARYRCKDCSGCPCRNACCHAKDPDQPKEVRLQKTFWEKRAVSQKNITTEHGIYVRMCRSIQVEGTFGLLKNDFGFRRFLTKEKVNVTAECYFLALGFNLKKLWMKREKNRLQTHLSEIHTA